MTRNLQVRGGLLSVTFGGIESAMAVTSADNLVMSTLNGDKFMDWRTCTL